MESVLEVLLLLGRPASGKSEFIDYMQRQPPARRRRRYGLGNLVIVDDFTFLWTKFEEDDILERLGRERLWSRRIEPSYTTTDPLIWPFLIEKINLAALKLLDAGAVRPGHDTLLIEFSRGGPTAYRDALARLDGRLLRRAAILYIQVSFEESCRRNRARYDEARKGSILAHSVPEEAMRAVYRLDDWQTLTAPHPTHLPLPLPRGGEGGGRGDRLTQQAGRLPYVTMLNQPESTDPAVLDARYGQALAELMRRWQSAQGQPLPNSPAGAGSSRRISARR